ncbi:hypothetical protein ACFQVC_42210 [Streptomyces monticola]|uniref:Questin oxidase family protein n=1 Tax=Streptomyces monticola TaxID=2666263 RepID=A0ABW2JXI7_9ACTN
MTAVTYTEAVNDALERLSSLGYEHGPAFVNHAPMAAEALAYMGYTESLPEWIERNLRLRSYHPQPECRWPLSPYDPAEWRPALGDFDRVADWTALFARELAQEEWRHVLARWWPRLLPGTLGALGHGVIRTAHAVRAVALAGDDARLQLDELARGLGYWAARYKDVPGGTGPGRKGVSAGAVADIPFDHDSDSDRDSDSDGGGAALVGLDTLVAEAAGRYARTPQHNPVPLIHAVTVPAAIRLVCAHLPVAQRLPSYLAARDSVRVMESYFGAGPAGATGAVRPVAGLPAGAELFATAAALGDEHAIKLAEVAVRHNVLAPDHRYAAAAHVANEALARLTP